MIPTIKLLWLIYSTCNISHLGELLESEKWEVIGRPCVSWAWLAHETGRVHTVPCFPPALALAASCSVDISARGLRSRPAAPLCWEPSKLWGNSTARRHNRWTKKRTVEITYHWNQPLSGLFLNLKKKTKQQTSFQNIIFTHKFIQIYKIYVIIRIQNNLMCI